MLLNLFLILTILKDLLILMNFIILIKIKNLKKKMKLEESIFSMISQLECFKNLKSSKLTNINLNKIELWEQIYIIFTTTYRKIKIKTVLYLILICKDILNIFYGGTKKPLRKIKDIVSCGYLSNKTFFIDIKLDGKIKQIVYEVKHVNVRNEIVAKIKYLIVHIFFNLFRK